MKNIKERLKEGETIEFENEDDMMSIRFDSSWSSQKLWLIELNCKFIHSSKTFGSFEKKLNKLINERNLIEC